LRFENGSAGGRFEKKKAVLAKEEREKKKISLNVLGREMFVSWVGERN